MNPSETPLPPLPPSSTMSPEQLHSDLNAIRSVLNEGVTARNPHRTAIAAGNLICGFFALIAVPVLIIVFSIPAISAPHEEGVLIPLFIGLGIAAILVVTASPFLLAGWGLLKNKSWGVAAALVSCAFNLLNFPFGTALSVYTIWAVSSGNLVTAPKTGRL